MPRGSAALSHSNACVADTGLKHWSHQRNKEIKHDDYIRVKQRNKEIRHDVYVRVKQRNKEIKHDDYVRVKQRNKKIKHDQTNMKRK